MTQPSPRLDQDYTLELSNPQAIKAARRWLMLGIFSLLAAGIYALLLVLSRTPAIHEMIPLLDFFHIALVVHVDLSVLIWFLSFAGVLFSLISVHKFRIWDRAAFILSLSGAVILVISPFLGAANPIMNNYVPVLDDPLFFASLLLFGAGFLMVTLRTLLSGRSVLRLKMPEDLMKFAIYSAAIAALLSMIALAWSYVGAPKDWEGESYYELLFWGGGHVLQFTHTALMLVAWFWLASASGARISMKVKTGAVLFALVILPAFSMFFVYLNYEVATAEHRTGFTHMMRFGGLFSILPALFVAQGLWRSWRSKSEGARHTPETKPLRAALYCSIALFAMGGVLSFMIEGVNVVIPAHYHGSIVGVTLSFMGLTYLLLPKLGFAPVMPRLAHIQPYVYGGGQLMHIIGLAWSGGYGVQRKTAGAAQGLDSLPEIAGMALMGLGGLISIIGGLLFAIVALRSLFGSRV